MSVCTVCTFRWSYTVWREEIVVVSNVDVVVADIARRYPQQSPSIAIGGLHTRLRLAGIPWRRGRQNSHGIVNACQVCRIANASLRLLRWLKPGGEKAR